ncbi:MAG: hypothetical protein H8D45_32930 [Bacteroidetes bacterium]|nr:hypothetical protein [Bacteroidota bacterium]
MNNIYPTCIYFVRRPSEYVTFVGRLCKIAALGYNLGLDAMLVTESNIPRNAPPAFSCPGIWVEYSDKSFQSVGTLY